MAEEDVGEKLGQVLRHIFERSEGDRVKLDKLIEVLEQKGILTSSDVDEVNMAEVDTAYSTRLVFGVKAKKV